MTTTGRGSAQHTSNMAAPLPDLLAQRREEARRLKESAALRRSNSIAPDASAPELDTPTRASSYSSPSPSPSARPTSASSAHQTAAARPNNVSRLQPCASFDGRRSASLRGFGVTPPSGSGGPMDIDKLREQARALRGLPTTPTRASAAMDAQSHASIKADGASAGQRHHPIMGSCPLRQSDSGTAPPTTTTTTTSSSGVRRKVSAALSGIADRMARRSQLRASANPPSTTAAKTTTSSQPSHAASESSSSPTKAQQRPMSSTHHSARVDSTRLSASCVSSSPGGTPSRLRGEAGVDVGVRVRAQSGGKLDYKVASESSPSASPFASSPQNRPATQSPYASPSRGQASHPSSPSMMRAPRPTPTPTRPQQPHMSSNGGGSRPQSPAMEQPRKVTRVGSFDSSKSTGSPVSTSRVNSGNVPSPRTPDSRVPPRSARGPSPPSTSRASTPSPCPTPAKAFAPWEAGDSVHAIRTASKKLTKEQFMEYIYTKHQLKDPSKTLNAQLPIKKQMQRALSHYHPDKQNLTQDGPEWCLVCEEICKEITRMYKKREAPAK